MPPPIKEAVLTYADEQTKKRRKIMKNSIITKELVQTIIEKRKREIHKGDCGRILMVTGSVGMAGAAVLSARGALRAGSGLVQAAIPKELFPIVQTGVPEATCVERNFSKTDLSRYDSVGIGCGLGESEEAIEAVKYVLSHFEGPVIVDADGLNIIAHNDLFDLLKKRPAGTTVITPHIGEAKRLLEGQGEMPEARQEMAKALVEKTGAIAVLKGQATLVATDGEKTYTNTTGNPGMATAGSGDVLTGIITSLSAQKKPDGSRISAEEAAVAGVFVHGLAGDLAALEIGEYGLIAGDIAYYTAIALKNVSG